MPKLPKNYVMIQRRFPKVMASHEQTGMLASEAGPLDAKTGHLIQLAACVALHSEGGVHSHARRALQAGASEAEIYHTLALLINTVGFPNTAAAFSWVNDLFKKK